MKISHVEGFVGEEVTDSNLIDDILTDLNNEEPQQGPSIEDRKCESDPLSLTAIIVAQQEDLRQMQLENDRLKLKLQREQAKRRSFVSHLENLQQSINNLGGQVAEVISEFAEEDSESSSKCPSPGNSTCGNPEQTPHYMDYFQTLDTGVVNSVVENLDEFLQNAASPSENEFQVASHLEPEPGPSTAFNSLAGIKEESVEPEEDESSPGQIIQEEPPAEAVQAPPEVVPRQILEAVETPRRCRSNQQRLKCPNKNCQQIIFGLKNLTEHCLIRHEVSLVVTRKNEVCTICGFHFETMKELEDHQQSTCSRPTSSNPVKTKFYKYNTGDVDAPARKRARLWKKLKLRAHI